jgi:hypothetical protein
VSAVLWATKPVDEVTFAMHLPTIAYIAGVTCVLPAIASVVRYKSLTSPMKVMTGLFVMYASVVAVQYWLGQKGIQNLWIGQIHTLVEFSLFTLVFSMWVGPGTLQRILRWSIAAYTVIWCILKVTIEHPGQFDNYSGSMAKLILMGLATYTIRISFQNIESNLLTYARVWVSAGILLYSAGTLLILAASNQILKLSPEGFLTLWHVNWSMLILSNLLYSRAFLCKE